MAPAGRIATRYVDVEPALLVITKVLSTVLVAAGTVYSVVAVVAEGFDCPKTLYIVAMIYIPESKNTLKSPAPAGPVAPAGPDGPVAPVVPVPVGPVGPVAPGTVLAGPVGPLAP